MKPWGVSFHTFDAIFAGNYGGGIIPHFSRAFYCGVGSGHVCCVALGRAPRRTVEYACGALGRAPCIHARLRRLATITREKCGLSWTDSSVRPDSASMFAGGELRIQQIMEASGGIASSQGRRALEIRSDLSTLTPDGIWRV